MSVFKGNILEYPGVIVDRFNVSNCRRGRVFFLSHCHKDHMSGLDSNDLLIALRERKISFYCSEVTSALLSNDPEFSHLIPYLSSLPIEETINLKLVPFREEDTLVTITVTLLPAGHCPGSVMFLFQGESGNVLYTGDFRLSVEELKRCGPLHNKLTGGVLNISTVYLDTTFCHPKSMNIVTRDETRDIIIKKVKEWLAQDLHNVVHLDCRSFGYEHIFLSLSNQLSTKIHIDTWKMRSYSILPTVQECLTLEGTSTRIHACSYKKGHYSTGLPCGFETSTGQSVLHIKPSAQWFVTSGWSQPYRLIKEKNLFRVMHSMHASFSELRDFVSYLSPTSIIPCVIPATLGDTSLLDLHGRLRSLLSSTVPSSSSSLGNNGQLIRKRKLVNDKKRAEYIKQKEAWSIKEKAESVRVGVESLKEAESLNEGAESQQVEFNSDYETDDEILSDSFPCLSPTHSSSSSNSFPFTFNLPALTSSDNNSERVVIPCVQPVVSLSFDFDETPPPVPVKKPKIDTTTPTMTTPSDCFIDLTQSSDDTNGVSHDDLHGDHSYHSNSEGPPSIIVISDSLSPVQVVSLSGSSSSTKDTPSLKDMPPENTPSLKDTPPKDTPPKCILSPSPVSRSPSVIPLTPLKEDSESLLSKRNFVFM